VFPKYFLRFTGWITAKDEGNPKAIRLDDSYARRASIDAKQVVIKQLGGVDPGEFMDFFLKAHVPVGKEPGRPSEREGLSSPPRVLWPIEPQSRATPEVVIPPKKGIQTLGPCPRCVNNGKYTCDICSLKGIRLDKYQAHRLCPLCRAVALCEACDDIEEKAYFRQRKSYPLVKDAQKEHVLPREVLDGKQPLRSFADLKSFFEARTKEKNQG
jgi:hypothetical protein